MISLIADSTCDLSKEIVKQYHIKIISTKVIISGATLNDYDYEGETLDELYKSIEDITETPAYEAPSTEEYLFAIEEGLFNGITEFIIFVPSTQTIDEFSGIVNNAINHFLEDNRVTDVRIRVINTLNASLGFGYSILKAGKMLKDGATFVEIIDYCENNKNKVKNFMSIPDVDFLHKTGNIKKGAAKATKLLGITPVLKVGTTGKVTLASKVIGEDKIAHCFANEFKHHGDMESSNFILIGYSTNKDKAIQVKEAIAKESPNFKGEVHIMQMRPAVGAHLGKNAVSIYFLGKQASVALFNIFRHN